MDIAALSTGMASSKLMQAASLLVTKQAMNVATQQMQGMVEMMQTAAPSFGHQLDVRA